MSQIERVLAGQLDSHVRESCLLNGKQRGGEKGIGIRRPAYMKDEVRILHRGAGGLERSVTIKKRDAGLFDIGAAGLIQLYFFSISVEEPSAQPRFELCDIPRYY